jgi:GAF domain
MNVLNWGIDEEYPDYLNRKIVISNTIGLIVSLMVALPFVFISLIFFPPLTYLPVAAIPIALSTLLLNYLRLHSLARIIISLVPICLAAIYQGYLSKKGAAVTPGLAMIMLSFSFIIFVIFDLREKRSLIFLGVIMAIVMLSVDWLNDALEIELETQIIETGFLPKLITIISIVSGGGCIMMLVAQNRQAENKAAQLLKQEETNLKMMLDKEQELKDNLSQLEEAQKEEKKRQWANEGLTKCIAIIRNQPDLRTLYSELISFIVKCVNANQGGLFLLNEDNPEDPFLELSAAYAYERKKFIQKRVNIGEGLLGQCFLEKGYVYVKQIPDNYVTITSGLGTANPTSLLLVPLKVDENVLGVIELASFKEFADHEIRFVELIGENMAATFQNLKTNSRTKELLAASQQQTEEMRAQEEEMRQNMEELTATQEEMQRKQKEFEMVAIKAQDSEAETKLIMKNLEQQNFQLREQEEMFRTYLAEAQAEFERKEAEYQARIVEMEKLS